MNTNNTIIVTGAAGFIGSCMVEFLNQKGYENIYIVDDFGVEEKRKNWEQKKFIKAIERQSLIEWLQLNNPTIHAIIHLGARTDTTEFNYAIHEELNIEYSKNLWAYCVAKNIPFIYASSAATYGDGNLGYDDNHVLPFSLEPLNPYGKSKNEFDKWLIENTEKKSSENKEANFPFWAGLKFFNVYGPNEYHKGRMASVIWHAFNQIKTVGFVKLFKSHRPDFKDGQQLRDFIYVKDLVQVIYWMMETIFNDTPVIESGLYNLGTGKARSFEDLVKATFAGLDLEAKIEFIDMPLDIRDKYQYFTEANMQKLINAGYIQPFFSLEEGVIDYVKNYLNRQKKIY